MADEPDILDASTPEGRRARYLTEIEGGEKWQKDWHERARKVLQRYKDERATEASPGGVASDARRYNILWSNVSTLQPAIYARRPKPVVERRFRDADRVGKVASETLERATTYAIDYDCFDRVIRQCRDDRLLPGRGTAWVRYVPHFKAVPGQAPPDGAADDGVSVTDHAEEHAGAEPDGQQPEPQEVLDYETVEHDYVHWRDFGHNPARTWEEVYIVWRRVQMGREELVARFGKKIGGAVTLDAKPTVGDPQNNEARIRNEMHSRAWVYEIWDKRDRKVRWLSRGYQAGLLDERPDPLRLRDFFPSPRPLYATVTTDSLIPVPDYTLYQDQAAELDDLNARLAKLVEACKVVGIYDATQDSSIGRMLMPGTENKMIPVTTWASFAQAGGIKGAVDFMPLDQITVAIKELTARIEAVKGQIYEITGIADIIRGYSAPSETATAQKIKGQFAALRLQDMQAEVARFARDLVALTAEIIAEHFQPQTIALMAGVAEQDQETQQLFPQAVELLRNDAMRGFRVDIETDSTVAVDEQADQASAQQLVTSMATFFKEGMPIAAQAPELLPLMGQTLLFLVRRHKGGRSFEGAIEQAMDAIQQRAQAAQQQPPPPDPKMVEAEAKVQAKQMETQASIQMKGAEMQADQQREDARLRGDMALAQFEAQVNAEARMTEAQQPRMNGTQQ